MGNAIGRVADGMMHCMVGYAIFKIGKNLEFFVNQNFLLIEIFELKSDHQRIKRGHIRGQNINQIFVTVVQKCYTKKRHDFFPNLIK